MWHLERVRGRWGIWRGLGGGALVVCIIETKWLVAVY